MPKKLIPNGQEIRAMRELLESPVFPASLNGLRYFEVQSDDNDGDPTIDRLTVVIALDGDVHVHIINGGSCRFRMPLFDGGHHDRVRQAALILAEAIRLEAEEGISGSEVG